MVKFFFTLPENKRNEYCKAQEKMDSVKKPQNLSTDTEFPAEGKKRGELITLLLQKS